MAMLSTLDGSQARPNRLTEYDLTKDHQTDYDKNSGGDKVKPFLLLRQTKDRLNLRTAGQASSFGFTFSNGFKDQRLALKTLCTIAAARDDEDLHAASAAPLADHAQLLGWVVQTLFQSPTAKSMLQDAATKGWSIELDDLDSHDFHLDVPEKHIVINTHGLGAASLSRSDYFRNLMIVSLARALRDVWQESRHGGFEDMFGPESILMLERVRAADCDTITILVAWELRCADLSDMWRHILGSDEGDLAMTFSNYTEKKMEEPNLHKALHATFRQWFASEDRINICDHETLEYLDDLIALEGRSIFGAQHLQAKNLEILSCLPDKTAYLQGHGRELVSDPLYAGMADPINQSHFMHIMHDMQAVTVGGVPFRSETLAAKFFPQDLQSETVNA